jgi:hypothetical protein
LVPQKNLKTSFFEDEPFGFYLQQKCVQLQSKYDQNDQKQSSLSPVELEWFTVCKLYEVDKWNTEKAPDDPITLEEIPKERQVRLRTFNGHIQKYQLTCYDIESLKILLLIAMLDQQDKHSTSTSTSASSVVNVLELKIKNPNGSGDFTPEQVKYICDHPYQLKNTIIDSYRSQHKKGTLERKTKQQTEDHLLAQKMESDTLEQGVEASIQEAYMEDNSDEDSDCLNDVLEHSDIKLVIKNEQEQKLTTCKLDSEIKQLKMDVDPLSYQILNSNSEEIDQFRRDATKALRMILNSAREVFTQIEANQHKLFERVKVDFTRDVVHIIAKTQRLIRLCS